MNGESVPSIKIKEAGEMLLVIYGQHEHQSLLKPAKHLLLLDDYAREELDPLKKKMAVLYEEYKLLSLEYNNANLDESQRTRQLDFLEHEVAELESARLIPGEDEQLEEEYRKFSHSQKIMEAVFESCQEISGENAASDRISRALRELRSVEEYDEGLSSMVSALTDLDSLMTDVNRELSDYMEQSSFSKERFIEIEERLNLLNHLKSKYGSTIESMLEAKEHRKQEMEKLLSYDEYLAELKKKLQLSSKALQDVSEEVSAIRKQKAKELTIQVQKSLLSLNFLDVAFQMQFETIEEFSANGIDRAQFYISTNPGEALRPLKDIASGGELSRIMLAMKTILAENDDIDTMIFDEIDAGISGRTAQAVSEKLHTVAVSHQVICITHLPQIAAMADSHYLIFKSIVKEATVSSIRKLMKEQSVSEVARMLGGSTITDATLLNARELIAFADNYKKD